MAFSMKAVPGRPSILQEESEMEFTSFEGEESSASASASPLQEKLCRTTEHLLDHKIFLAARRIQRYWRAYRARKLRDRRWQAAITIQRWWRGFWVRSRYYLRVEKLLQATIEDYHNKAAIKIQSAIRGYFDRRFIHDARRLHKMQTDVLEDFLYCLVDELRTIKSETMMPGIHSLAGSRCTLRIEKLMNTLSFRFHNARVLTLVSRRETQSEDRRKYFEKSKFYTEVPFSGPNFNQLCASRVETEIDNPNEVNDPRYQKVIYGFDKMKQDNKLKQLLRVKNSRKRLEALKEHREREMYNNKEFCREVIESMRKWEIWADDITFNIRDDIFASPSNMETFLDRSWNMMQKYQPLSCHCKNRTVFDRTYDEKDQTCV